MSLPEDRYELTGRRAKNSEEELLTRLNELIYIKRLKIISSARIKVKLKQTLRKGWGGRLQNLVS